MNDPFYMTRCLVAFLDATHLATFLGATVDALLRQLPMLRFSESFYWDKTLVAFGSLAIVTCVALLGQKVTSR